MQQTETILDILNRKALIGNLVLTKSMEGLNEQGLGIQAESPRMNPTMIQNQFTKEATVSGAIHGAITEARGHPTTSHSWETGEKRSNSTIQELKCQTKKLLPPPLLLRIQEVGGWTLNYCCMETCFPQPCNIQKPQEGGLCLISLFKSCR